MKCRGSYSRELNRGIRSREPQAQSRYELAGLLARCASGAGEGVVVVKMDVLECKLRPNVELRPDKIEQRTYTPTLCCAPKPEHAPQPWVYG